jgi:hypothetical protein
MLQSGWLQCFIQLVGCFVLISVDLFDSFLFDLYCGMFQFKADHRKDTVTTTPFMPAQVIISNQQDNTSNSNNDSNQTDREKDWLYLQKGANPIEPHLLCNLIQTLPMGQGEDKRQQ